MVLLRNLSRSWNWIVGFYTLGVNSDDGFSATIGPNFADVTTQQIGLFNGGRGASDSIFSIWVDEGGLYPFRVSWWEGGGGANIEIFSIVNGQKILINDPDHDDAIKAYTIAGAVVDESTTETRPHWPPRSDQPLSQAWG